jgi:hypothetical protein
MLSGRTNAERRCSEATGRSVVAGGRHQEAAMSDFIFLFRAAEADRREAMGTPERAQKSLQAWLAWIRELEAKGHLKNPGQPLEPGGKVVRGKKRIVTDGPYVETKELVLGFIIVQARDLEQAVELSTGCPMLDGGGSVEVRPIEVGMPSRA